MHDFRGRVYSKDYFLVSIVVGSYLLHLFRNISEFYAAFPVILSVMGFLYYSARRIKIDSIGVCVFFVFVLLYFLPLIYSFLWYPDEDYLVPFARYLYIVPFIVFCIFAISNVGIFVYVLKVFSVFMVLGGVSIFYQIIFGPISWFPDASEREGLVRFSSLVGSLTAYGILGGLALPVILYLFENKLVRNASLLIILMAMLCTLQKAAIANIILFLCFLFFSSDLLSKLKLIGFAVLILPAVIFVFYYFDVSYVVATMDNVLRFREGSGGSDVSFHQSMLDRLWSLPSKLYEVHGGAGMIYGVGMVGGSGALGFPEYPMAHNVFFDLLFIGGALNLLAFLFIVGFVLCRLWVLKRICVPQGFSCDLLKVSIFVYVLLLVNMLFSGPLHVHPYGGVVFYTITIFVCLRPDEIKRYAFSEEGII